VSTPQLSPTSFLSSFHHISCSPIDFSPSHLSSIHCPTCTTLLHITSIPLHLISHLCCPTVSPQPLCLLHLAIVQPSSPHIVPSFCKILVHVHDYLSIPASIQLSSRWKNAEATKFHRCSANSGLLVLIEVFIGVGWWWLNIVSTINGNLREELSDSQLSCRAFLTHDCV
jgi:hypothetical protein